MFLSTVLLVTAIISGLHGQFEARTDDEMRSFLSGFGETGLPEPRGRYGRTTKRVQIWQNRTLIFEVDKDAFSAEELRTINESIGELAARTCVLFKERQDEVYYVNITRIESGCWSSLGRVSKPGQKLNLGPNCVYKSVVLHELMHALGFDHEHQRPCRYDFVTINWSNIQEDFKHAFNRRTEEEEELLDIDYNYESIMHYERYAFAINRSIPTIIPKETDVTVGGQNLTVSDLMKVERLYKCGKALQYIV